MEQGCLRLYRRYSTDFYACPKFHHFKGLRMEQNNLKCPNCGRNLTGSELYCYFCETDLAEIEKKKTALKSGKTKNDSQQKKHAKIRKKFYRRKIQKISKNKKI